MSISRMRLTTSEYAAQAPMPMSCAVMLPSTPPMAPRGEHAGEHGADDAADAVDAERIERVVVAEPA